METAQQLDKPSLGNNDAAKDKAINERDAMTQDTPYPDQTVGKPFVDNPKMRLRDVEVFYADNQAIHGVSLDIGKNEVVSLIGPSGCGKSTFLRCLNRMNDTIDICRVKGDLHLEGQDLYDPKLDVVELRARVGMVFQKPNPFPKSIYDNVAYGPRIHGLANKKYDLDEIVENSLRKAGLWDEVKDRLHRSAWQLSGGQQQRLVIARTLAVQPDVLLLDEPASALDPISTLKIEELIRNLKSQLTLVLVTHNMQQAARVSDYTAFLQQGELVEYGPTDQVFTNPRLQRTENYITGRMT